MSKREIRSREDIEFEWLLKARVQAIDERMNTIINSVYFASRVDGPNKKSSEASLLDSKNLVKKFDTILGAIEDKLEEYK